MNILLLGSGGREHALAWKIRQSKKCNSLFIAPGNPGTASCGTNVALSPNDFDSIASFCKEKQIEMIVVGPEDPLVNGIYDFIKSNSETSHIVVVGPSKQGALLEGSKAYAKAFMQRHSIPTASYKEFTKENYNEGFEYIRAHSLPIVLKADGLAGGKGVVIASTHKEALETFSSMILSSQFGAAGDKVVIEQFLTGVELSVFALTNGEQFVVLPEAKDYKRIGEGDTGPNTGGMGAVSPVPFADDKFRGKVLSQVVEPTIKGLREEGIVYKGFVFFGLIKVNDEPFVIEYNCRMGDPETEVVMPRLDSDLIDLFLAMEQGSLDQEMIKTDSRAAATVVVVSGGYPGEYEKGKKVNGMDRSWGSDTLPFYAGIQLKGNDLVTSGGRVLAITSYGTGLQDAVDKSLKEIEHIQFEKMNFRKDIGYEFR
jgi:phosphoribosylamine--glycine ligase